MRIAYVDEQISALAAGAPLLFSLSLGGSATAGSSLIDARAESPASGKVRAYLPVEDVPPRPEKPAMTVDEMSKLKKDLGGVRDRQMSKVKAREGAVPPKPIKPQNNGRSCCLVRSKVIGQARAEQHKAATVTAVTAGTINPHLPKKFFGSARVADWLNDAET